LFVCLFVLIDAQAGPVNLDPADLPRGTWSVLG
jgi:hypothetical protein